MRRLGRAAAAARIGGAAILIPLLALAALVADRDIRPGPACVAALASLAGAACAVWPRRREPSDSAEAPGPAQIDPPDTTAADRAILDALPDPLLVVGPDRLVRYVNQAARRDLGGDISAILRHPTLRGAIDRLQGGSRAIEAVDLLVPVPVPRDLHATVIDLGAGHAEAGAFLGTAVVFADRTRARAVERMRADFVANASHELRTPLASLIGFIDTLRGPALDDAPAQRRFLGIMAEQAARMNRLIDDLLSLSRIELTEHVTPDARIDLAGVIARTLSSFEPRRAEAGVSVRQHVHPDLPPVQADADQIEQVLQNLLDNALKYGRRDGIIEVGLQPAAYAGGPAGSSGGAGWPARPGVVLSVRDDGQGIPRAHLPRLTERFYRVDRGRSRAAGGTGLGLAIVKHIVNRHRGQLAIDSAEGAGSTFSIWLPLVP